MRRALLACSLLGAAFALIQGPSDAQTVYTLGGWQDTDTADGIDREYFTLETYDLDTGTVKEGSNAPLKILRKEFDGSSNTFYSSINGQGMYDDGYAYFSGREYKTVGSNGAVNYDAIYKIDLSDFSYEIIQAQDRSFSWSPTGAMAFIGPANSDGGSVGPAIDLSPVHKRIDDNKSAIHKNKKAIDTNRTNINNLGDGIAASTALGAALSALPVTPDDAPFSCGVGSGAYSSRFAMGLGCVAKLNQRLSLNAGGSHVFGGSSNYGGGSLDSVAWRGGFVFKLGKLDSPAATNEQLQSKVKELEERNAAVDAKYSEMKAKYSTIEEQNKALMARLERLEAIALGQQPATTTASLK